MVRRTGLVALFGATIVSAWLLALVAGSPALLAQETGAQETGAQEPAAPESAPPEAAAPDATPADAGAKPKKGLLPLNRKGSVKIDLERKIVVIDGRIALRAGQLEMFACPAGTKEHESVVAVDTDSRTVHGALLAIGASPGAVVKFDPEYAPAYGDVVEIFVVWNDEQGKPHQVRAQSWVRDAKTNEELKSDWVFGGSGEWTDPADGRTYYYADGGELICVSNFPTAMLDLPIESSESNESLLFEAFTERIPARGTPVRLVLRRAPKPGTPKEVPPSAESAPATPTEEPEAAPPEAPTP